MAFQSYNPHARYKERAIHRFSSALGFLALIIICLLAGYWFGLQQAGEAVIMANRKIEILEAEKVQTQERITELSAAAQTAIKRYEKLEQDVNAIIPKGAMQEIVTLIREQLDKGMKPERLIYLVKSGRPPTGCVEPDNKRFVIKTPTYQGADNKITIGDGLIDISGNGVSAKSEGGKPEAWFDPTKPVEIIFTYEGKTESKRGTLPLRHFIVVNGREYRFNVETGAQSFAKVVFDSCNYP